MTFNDKPKRPGSKPFVRDKQTKPRAKSADAKPVKAAGERPAAATFADGAERISKVMARAGVASRRDIERMITEGRVKLNGVLLDSPVVNVTLTDKIEVDGVPIRGIERTRLWLYHKPAGLVTTNSDPEGRATVFDNLPDELPRVMSIGRLDINTEGLLLLTNDGGLARVLELPTTGWLRRYRVRAHGDIKQEELDKLKEGIAVDGVLYGSIEATLDRTQGSNVWITMGLREGKNREIKNVLGAMGLEVNRLIRISYGPFQLGELPESDVVEVRGRTLRDQLGPRLVEDAKANFDAPIYNAPATAADDDEDEVRAERAPQREEWVKRDKPGDKRERALGRLDTKRDDSRESGRKDGPRKDGGRKDDDRPKRAPLSTPRRSANVWMAPGARPLGEKATIKAAKTLEKYGPSKRGPRDKPGSDRPDTGPRVRVNRIDDADGEWIRASDVSDEKSQGFGRKRADGDRPRGDRPQGDRPRGERPQGDRPRGDRPQGDRPRGDRPSGDRPARSFSDRPRGDKPYGDKPRGPGRMRTEGDERPRAKPFRADSRAAEAPRGERTFSDRPRGERPQGDRPRSDRPQGERPARSFSDRPPRGDKPFGEGRPRAEGNERPRGAKPSGERSYGDKPAGAKPSGRPSGAKPAGRPAGKSFGGKPTGKPGAKSFSGKPRGEGGGSGRPSGGAPRGGPRGKRG